MLYFSRKPKVLWNEIAEKPEDIVIEETGRFIPALSFSDGDDGWEYSFSKGEYVRENSLVWVTFDIKTLLKPTAASGFLQITGLPFVLSGYSNFYQYAIVRNGQPPKHKLFVAQTVKNTPSLRMRLLGTNSRGFRDVSLDHIKDTSIYNCTFSYKTE